MNHLHGHTVLVVEDDRPFRELAVMVLEHWGAKVYSAGTVAIAAKLLEDHDIDAALIDIVLDDQEDGYDLRNRIRSGRRNRDVPLVAMSGAEPSREQRAKFEAWLVKPVEAVVIAAEIAAVLLRRAASRSSVRTAERAEGVDTALAVGTRKGS